jgi:putative transposase
MSDFIIRTSSHTTSFSNKEKQDNLRIFVCEARRAMKLMIDAAWEKGITWTDKNNAVHTFSVRDNKLNVPSFLDYNDFEIDTFLTARAMSSIATQVDGMIKAAVEKQKKRLYVYEKRKAAGESRAKLKSLAKAIKTNIPQKPNCSNANIELSSKCIDWQDSTGEFMGFIRLKSITKNKTEIIIPVKAHKHSNKFFGKGERLNSFLISQSKIDIRWKLKKPDIKEDGLVVGADQGMKTVITFSNNEVTPPRDVHGHDLQSILTKLSRKKKGSNAFKRAQEHRKNFINWSINQLNLSDVKELRLEEIINIGYKTRQSRVMSHWTNTAIRDKITSKCEESGTRLVLQSSTYRSQRCSGCGVVRKANRKRKIYSCKHCGLELDADLNASLNHAVDLPEIPYTLRKLEINRGNGFYWKTDGFYEFSTGRKMEFLPPVEDKK